MDKHEKWSKCKAEAHTLGQERLQGLVVGCRVTDEKPLQFQASSSSQKKDVALLLVCSASCCRECVAGSVNSNSSSQSISKAPKLTQRERVQVCMYRSIISLVCCIKAVHTQHLCQSCLMCSRVKVIKQLLTQGEIYFSKFLAQFFSVTDLTRYVIRGGFSTLAVLCQNGNKNMLPNLKKQLKNE